MRHRLLVVGASIFATLHVAPLAAAAAGESRADIVIEKQRGRWTGLPKSDPLGGIEEAGGFFVISGALRNVGTRPIAYAKLLFELLDANGLVVHREYGYNRAAEELRGPEFESGSVTRGELDISPIAPGTIDSFRMLFLSGDLPQFESWRVKVLEVGYDNEWTRRRPTDSYRGDQPRG